MFQSKKQTRCVTVCMTICQLQFTHKYIVDISKKKKDKNITKTHQSQIKWFSVYLFLFQFSECVSHWNNWYNRNKKSERSIEIVVSLRRTHCTQFYPVSTTTMHIWFRLNSIRFCIQIHVTVCRLVVFFFSLCTKYIKVKMFNAQCCRELMYPCACVPMCNNATVAELNFNMFRIIAFHCELKMKEKKMMPNHSKVTMEFDRMHFFDNGAHSQNTNKLHLILSLITN